MSRRHTGFPKRYLFQFLCIPALLVCLSWHIPRGMRAAAAQTQAASTLHGEVELVTIEVAVLDRGGNPVRNLKKEDFRLFEDGKPQEISVFDEVAEAAGQASAPANIDVGGPKRGKTVLILFDDSHITSRNLKTARDSAEKYVKEHMRPQDLFAVASFGSSLKILQNLVNDQAKVAEAIRQPATSSALAASRLAIQNEPESQDITEGRTRTEERPLTVGQENRYRAAPLLRTLSSLCSSLAPVKGRKTILVYSEAFAVTLELRTEYENMMNAAQRSNVSFCTIDTRGAKSGQPGGTVPTPVRDERGGQELYGQVHEQSMGNILGPLAEETGGVAIFNTSDFNAQLDKVDQELSNYYMLGFSPNNPRRDGRFRRIEVKTEAKGATLRYRNGYFDPRPLDTLASSREEALLISALASPGLATQLPISFRATYFYDSPRLTRVPVSARIRTAALELKKKGSQLGRDFNVIGVAYAEDGTMSARFSEGLHVVLDKENEASYRKQGITYRNYFRLQPGSYRLRLAIADEGGKIGSAEQPLVVPPFPDKVLAASGLVLADQLPRLPGLISNLQAGLLDESDPFIYSGLRIVPSIENLLPVNAPVRVFFRMYNLGREGQGNLVAQALLLGEKGEKRAIPQIMLAGHLFQTGKGEASIALNLPFENVAAGKYTLGIKVSDPASGQSVILQTDVQFK